MKDKQALGLAPGSITPPGTRNNTYLLNLVNAVLTVAAIAEQLVKVDTTDVD